MNAPADMIALLGADRDRWASCIMLARCQLAAANTELEIASITGRTVDWRLSRWLPFTAPFPPKCRAQGVQFMRQLVWEVLRMHHQDTINIKPRVQRHLPVSACTPSDPEAARSGPIWVRHWKAEWLVFGAEMRLQPSSPSARPPLLALPRYPGWAPGCCCWGFGITLASSTCAWAYPACGPVRRLCWRRRSCGHALPLPLRWVGVSRNEAAAMRRVTTGMRPMLPTTFLLDGSTGQWHFHALLIALVCACMSSVPMQELPAGLTEQQAASPACAALLHDMHILLPKLVDLSHLGDAGEQEVRGSWLAGPALCWWMQS